VAKEKSQPLDHKLLDALMKDAKLSNVALATELELRDSTIKRWRDGKHGPSGAEAIRLARRFGITVARLYGWPETPEDVALARIGALPDPQRRQVLEKIEAWLDGAEATSPSPSREAQLAAARAEREAEALRREKERKAAASPSQKGTPPRGALRPRGAG